MPINSKLLGNVNPQRTEQPRKGRMDSDSVGLAGVASGRDGGISNWTQSFGEDRNSRSLDSFTARATFQNILRCGLVLQFLQGIIMSPKISPACIHYLHLVLMTSTWIFIQIMTSRYDYALQWRWVSIGQKKSHALEFLKLGMSEYMASKSALVFRNSPAVDLVSFFPFPFYMIHVSLYFWCTIGIKSSEFSRQPAVFLLTVRYIFMLSLLPSHWVLEA